MLVPARHSNEKPHPLQNAQRMGHPKVQRRMPGPPAMTAAASKIPLLKPWAETIGDLASQGADLALKTKEACK